MRRLIRSWKAIATIVGVPMALSAISVLLLGQPLFLSFAHSGSMEPTLGVGDLFFIQPYPDDAALDDIVLFRSTQTGVITVHRVVERTPDGLVTKGDANAVSDQATGEDLLAAHDVIGRVIEVGGAPVTVPGVGLAIMEAQAQYRAVAQAMGGTTVVAFAGIVLLGLAEALVPKDRALRPSQLALRWHRLARRTMARFAGPTFLGKHVLLAALCVLAATMAISVWLSAATIDVGYAVNGENVGDPGERVAVGALGRSVKIEAMEWMPTHVHIAATPNTQPEASHLRLAAGQVTEVQVWYNGPAQAGYHGTTITAWHYPSILPAPAMSELAEVDPRLPAALPSLLIMMGLMVMVAVGRLADVRIDADRPDPSNPFVRAYLRAVRRSGQ